MSYLGAMKTLFLTLLLGASLNVIAETCPNITGDYISYYGIPVRFRQPDCTTLERHTGAKMVNGTWMYTVKRAFNLDGTPFCTDSGKCESATLENQTIKFSYNFKARKHFFDHGTCTELSATISKKANGNLIYTAPVESCDDGFKGDFIVEYVPFR